MNTNKLIDSLNDLKLLEYYFILLANDFQFIGEWFLFIGE